jgi:urease accessory protein UreF
MPPSRSMLDQTFHVPQSASEILGDLTALTQQLGDTEGLQSLSTAAAAFGTNRVDSVAGLEQFLREYTVVALIPHELPAIVRAYEHSVRSHVRELVALDQQLSQLPAQSFASASSTVGRMQLWRLRPLRGERVVQRYLQAVEAGQAKAWHTLVYGLVLAVYSLPLRQGLVHFAHQTLGGFIRAAGQRVRLSEADEIRMLGVHSEPLAAGIELAISQHARTPALLA